MMAVMKAYAQELLQQQGTADPGAAAGPQVAPPSLPGMHTPESTVHGVLTPRTAAGLGVDRLPLGVKQVAAADLDRRQHFQLGLTMPTPRRHTQPPGAATPLNPHLRTSIGASQRLRGTPAS